MFDENQRDIEKAGSFEEQINLIKIHKVLKEEEQKIFFSSTDNIVCKGEWRSRKNTLWIRVLQNRPDSRAKK